MQNLLTTFFFLASGVLFAQADLSSPDQFLPTKYGKEFTPYHLVVDYFQHIAAQSDKVIYQPYGYTTEKRKLGIAIISSPKNIQNLEQIRLNNLKITGLVDGKPDLDLAKAIVWINFGVHGNEAGTTETSMTLLYQLASTHFNLDDVVVIINPSLNPDGFDRYVNWNRSVIHEVLMPDVLSREHHEPWPNGRTNHFYFDLNRDWSWATQKETQQLLEIYHQWMPHVVTDLHEQRPNSGYYFAPATQPFHEYISAFQEEFQTTIGQANAHVFDKKGWLYFTKEIFDLFYPGYGDTYPMFNGAIGMTYEQAGNNTAGIGLRQEIGDTLLIQDRIDHHAIAAMTTIQTAGKNRTPLIKAFRQYFNRSRKGKNNTYSAYVIKKSDNPYVLQKLTELLDRHFIKYKTVKKTSKAHGFSYQSHRDTDFSYEQGDLVIPTKQPMGVLAQVLIEPTSILSDSITYDITAWALPYAFGLEAYATSATLPALTAFAKNKQNPDISTGAYAWVTEWNGANSAAFLAELLQKNIQVRYSTKPFSISGKTFGRGSLLVTQADNKNKKGSITKILAKAAKDHWVQIHSLTTGLTTSGPDIGSLSMKLIKKPKIAVVYDDQVNAYQYGEFWHFLDHELKQPFVALSLKDFESASVWEFNTLILVDGNYKFQKFKTKKYIQSWVKSGGKLILVGSACTAFNEDDLKLELSPDEMHFSDQSFKDYINPSYALNSAVPGGIIEVLIDPTHPLGYGYSKRTFSLKNNELSFALLSNGHNVGRTASQPKVIGYFGKNFLSHFGNNMIFGQRELGDGQVIYLSHSPIFRGFWEDGKLMVANALFFQ